MSPRNEQYLQLCIAQAAHSSLHYRHGCVIVKGGKVIGQGFNTYRPGFDGGALKTGQLSSAGLDAVAMAELKTRIKKSKPKPKPKSKPNASRLPSSTADDLHKFAPFEQAGPRSKCNALSMHSEMMAIQSALSLSSASQRGQTSSRGSGYLEKPFAKMSGDSKRRKRRQRALKTYVEVCCAEAGLDVKDKFGRASASEAKWSFETSYRSVYGGLREGEQIEEWLRERREGEAWL